MQVLMPCAHCTYVASQIKSSLPELQLKSCILAASATCFHLLATILRSLIALPQPAESTMHMEAFCCVWQDLGWSVNDTEGLCPALAQPEADAAGAPKGKAAAVPKKPASAEKKAPAATEGPMTEEVVSEFETPCHVAAVRGHHAAVLQLKEHLSASVAALKSSMSVWQKNEVANIERWALLLRSLNDAV